MENKENNSFNYTYSAKEQEEIKAIRQKYSPSGSEEDKMARLRRLDASASQKASVVSLIIGILGALIMGSGMSLAMTELGGTIGLSADTAMLIGILIGILGIALVCLAYPIYNRVLERERGKIAPEIIRLTDELMK